MILPRAHVAEWRRRHRRCQLLALSVYGSTYNPKITYRPATVLAATPSLKMGTQCAILATGNCRENRDLRVSRKQICIPPAISLSARHETKRRKLEEGKNKHRIPAPGVSIILEGSFDGENRVASDKPEDTRRPVVFCRSLTGRRTSSLAESRDSPPSARHGAYLVLTSKTTFSAARRRDTTRAAIEDKDMLASLRCALLGKRPFPSSRDREQQFSSSSAQQVSFSVASRVRSVRLRSGLRSDMRDCFRLVQYDPSARFDRTYVTGRSWLKLFSRIR